MKTNEVIEPFDFFAHGSLPAPQVSEDDAARLASSLLGESVKATSLGSQQDANFLLTGHDESAAGLDRHELIGAVHGSGLYLGVELVRDRTTLEPVQEETTRICERMLDLGVIIQPTSDRLCVLKVKPPLILDRSGADFFVEALDHALSTGF